MDGDTQQDGKTYERPTSINQDLKHSNSLGDDHSTLDGEVQPNNNKHLLKY